MAPNTQRTCKPGGTVEMTFFQKLCKFARKLDSLGMATPCPRRTTSKQQMRKVKTPRGKTFMTDYPNDDETLLSHSKLIDDRPEKGYLLTWGADKPCKVQKISHRDIDVRKLENFYDAWMLHIGLTLNTSFFRDSPQMHALLNRHLQDYFNGRQRANETTPYNIPTSQRHLLQRLGMEVPNPDAPECPHALHKCIEESQLRRLRRVLPANNYGLISVKDTKVSLLPPPATHQNPVFEAKDVSRYPGTAIKHARLDQHSLYLLHDVASEVTPHELVERLVSENPEAHLLVTGLNPAEVLDRATTWEPSSHTIEYDLENFNYIFADSEDEAYSTPIVVTATWLRTSSVCASNGRVYHVVLIENKLGHCLWHIFCGDALEQHTRTFSTYSMVQVPASISGTLTSEYMPAKLLSGILDFTARTPDLSTRNLAAKVTQVANGINPRTTAKERWIATHIAGQLAPIKTWDWLIKQNFWKLLYILSFQWQMLRPLPELYTYLDERKRSRTIHPTPGGGWTLQCRKKQLKRSIPNNPTWLHRLSAFTSSIFTFLIPKILIAEVLTMGFEHLDLIEMPKTLIRWFDIRPLRLILTASIVIVTAALPGHVVKVFSRLSGHFWRMLWLPGWFSLTSEIIITEITGGPGYRFFPTLPGRGWVYQIYIWSVGIFQIVPGLVGPKMLPWVAFTSPVSGAVLGSVFALIVLENVIGMSTKYWLTPPASVTGSWNLKRKLYIAVNWTQKLVASGFQRNLGNCQRLANLPPLPRPDPPTVRRRNVDIPLPTVIVQPHRIQNAGNNLALAVDPTGMNFRDWLQNLEQAYAANPNQYPQLTPGNACFWECVEPFGGTAHMWYSWYMAYTGQQHDPTDPIVGHMRLADIQKFSAMSRFGLNLIGMVNNITQAQGNDWPTLHLTLSRSVVDGVLHIETSGLQQPNTPVSNLARIFKVIHDLNPAWLVNERNAFNAQAPDRTPRPTPFLNAVAGQNEMPSTMLQIADALVASFHAQPFTAQANDGFAFDFRNVYQAPFPPLFDYQQPVTTQPIAFTAPSRMWQRFRSLSKDFRIPSWYPHPLSNPDMKIGANGRQQRDNIRRNNQRPEAPRWTELRNELSARLWSHRDIILPAVDLKEETIMYTADVARASRLAADLRAHPSVLESRSSNEILAGLDAIIDLHRLSGKTVTVPVRLYMGTSGSGKTTATKNYISSLPEDERTHVRVVSHTESLRAQAKVKLDFPNFRGFNFPTISSVICEPSTGKIILDDAGKFWGGVLDLILLANPLVDEVVVNGDPAQGVTTFPIRGTQSEHDPTAIQVLASKATRYATISHRLPRLTADTLGVHTTNDATGHITHTVAPKSGIPVCTASPRYVGVLAGAGRQAYTYESVQGEDFNTDVEVDMTGLEGAISDRTAYVALTRSNVGTYIHMDATDPKSVIKAPPTGSDLMNALVYAMREGNRDHLTRPSWLVKAAFYEHLSNCMPMLAWFAPIGATIPASEFQMIVPAASEHFVTDSSPNEPDMTEAVIPSTGAHDNIVPETHFVAKEFRELPGRGGTTDQFKETDFVNPHVHKRSDTGTYFLSVEKRLKSASPAQNRARMAACPRTDLIEEYDKLVPNPPIWSPESHDGYLDRAISEYLSKRTSDDVMKKLKSHDPDRSGSDIKISLKNQVIKKDEKRHKLSAIPGQLIHEYDILTTISDSAYALWFEDHIITAFPKNFLFYRRMGPQEFIEAYKSRWRVDNGVHTSDVTRWDVGCDAGVLNLDAHIMRASRFPESYVSSYIERRLTSRSQHGPMQTMQNSGDRYTWPINTVRRAVLASYLLDLTPEDTCAINGDDEAVDRRCEAKPFLDSEWEFKDQNGMRGEFSGFELGGPEPMYSDVGIHYRSLILRSRDPSAQDKWRNYLDLLKYANPDSHFSVDVAMKAHEFMNSDEFKDSLPTQYRALFPNVVFES
uniref:RNA-dependent RNA polymerase n=1 Tax=Pestalotiopsis deltaflexivirus 1 TaxID=2816841 RepID=A0A8A6C6R3_9VIRU|nr:MAG: RNA-dependent RNA polymerase [Pestalotiopsis deltaflexivirus 1]